MARIRTIKPEFFCHEELFDLEAACGLPIRLAFAGLWTVCDRDGRFVWRPRTLKAQVMPHDAVDFGQVLDALERGGFVQSYIADGVKCGFVPSWKRHQIINTRESVSKIPPPPHEQVSTEHVHARACTSQGTEYRGVNIAPALRETILTRDGGKCCRCGATEDMTVDHIFPQSIGGNHAPQNLRAMCRKCNSARPVAGKALIDDLAKDGLTLDDMQRTCMHMPSDVHAQVEGKGRERKGKEGVCSEANKSPSEPAFNPSECSFPTFPCSGTTRTWQATDRQLAEWSEAYPAVDIERAHRRAHAWIMANLAKRKTATGYAKFLTTWLSKEQDSGKSQRPAASVVPHKATALTKAEIEDLNRNGDVERFLR